MWCYFFPRHLFFIRIHASFNLAHNNKTIALVIGAKMFDLNDHMDSLHWIAMVILGCTFNNQVFCLSMVIKLSLTRAIKMACFVTSFTKVLALFTSNNNCTNLDINSLSTKVFFKTTLRLGTRFIMMGLDKTFCMTISFARTLGNVGKVFSIV